MQDETEEIRRLMQADINAVQDERKTLESQYGKVYSTSELTEDFTVHSFMAPFVVVTEKATGKRGSMMFQHSPRFYFAFEVI